MIIKFKNAYKEIVSITWIYDGRLEIVYKPNELKNLYTISRSNFKVKKLPRYINGYIDLTNYHSTEFTFVQTI